MIPGGVSYGGGDWQGSMGVPYQQPQYHDSSRYRSSVRGSFPLTMGSLQQRDHWIGLGDYDNRERGNDMTSDEDEEGIYVHNDARNEKNGSQWQRVKWTNKMVKLLITVLSYMGQDSGSGCGSLGRRRLVVLQKKGKWKSVSKVMGERGYHVSPQQCEDKFNDLNKRYKRLNDMLGRGTSCEVVENPALLDEIDYLKAKEKDDVRKILNSKHLFYEEMCSYHNGNRLHLPHDPELLHSLQLVNGNRIDSSRVARFVTNEVGAETDRICQLQQLQIESHCIELEEKRVRIEIGRLELEKERMKWERFKKKRERELEKLKLENERMRVENELIASQLKKRRCSHLHRI
ncbi:hypothetical protein SDJN03_01021, partial [Cucurbita argyrosperma subsp. sororia]